MKSARLALPLFLLPLLATPAFAQGQREQLNCAWRQARADVRADIDYVNGLLGLRCDAELAAAMRHRFAQFDAETLALYNRGIVAPTHTRTAPGPVSSPVLPSAARRGAGDSRR